GVRAGALELRVEPAARGLRLLPPVGHESPARVRKLDPGIGFAAPEHDDAHRRRDVVARLAEGRLPAAAADVPGALDRGFIGRDETAAHEGHSIAPQRAYNPAMTPNAAKNEALVRELLTEIGEDPQPEGLGKTP